MRDSVLYQKMLPIKYTKLQTVKIVNFFYKISSTDDLEFSASEKRKLIRGIILRFNIKKKTLTSKVENYEKQFKNSFVGFYNKVLDMIILKPRTIFILNRL